MSEATPLIDNKNMAVGPKGKDYVLVVLWPLLFALCGIGLFAFVLAVPPLDSITVYGAIALITMLLPIIPLITALALAVSGVCYHLQHFFRQCTFWLLAPFFSSSLFPLQPSRISDNHLSW